MVTPAQHEWERAWLSGLERLSLSPIALSREDYRPDPWADLTQTIKRAHGALILGFRQVRIDHAASLPDTVEAHAAGGWLATPWNHIEGGLAIMANLPVLIVPEDGIADGIFAPDTWTSNVRAAPMDLWTAPGPDADPSLRAWVTAVRQRFSG